jgi:hypothetical protein
VTPLVHDRAMNESEFPQQLTLLPSSDVPVQFRLDADTRRRGIQHVIEIRRLLAERQAAKQLAGTLPVRQPIRSRAA